VRLVRSAAAVALAASAVLVVALSAPAYAVEGDCKDIAVQDAAHYSTDAESVPLSAMEVTQAWQRLAQEGKQPGAGVVVAVIDSGVAAAAPIDVVAHVSAGNKQPSPEDYHGTAVAGLIAGKPRGDDPATTGVGIAPFARIYDVQVYDNPTAADSPDSQESPITVANVVHGLDAVITAAPGLGIRIVNMSLAVPDDPAIRDRVARLWDMGVVVVAPTGNRPSTEVPVPDLPPSFAEGHQSGEDAAPYIHPADYPHVLAVNASMTGLDSSVDPTSVVMENSMTKVAAPTAGAVSYSVRGESCVLTDPATSYATAEVSGVLALLQSAYDESIAASIQRLLTTANGREDVPNTLLGAGEVQPLDALTRPLVLDPSTGADLGEGTVRHEPQVLAVPEQPDDVLASTRRNAVWWGLLGGGTLLLALVLRPVLARRRRSLSR
jgi:membrane-anchored mycosin MYCP